MSSYSERNLNDTRKQTSSVLHEHLTFLKNVRERNLTGVNCIRRHSFPFHHASQLLCEVNVGQLAATVGKKWEQVVVKILEVQLLVLVVGAGERYHPAGGALFQPREEEVG